MEKSQMSSGYFGNCNFEKIFDEKVPKRINIESIKYDIEGFRVILKEEDCVDAKRVKLTFEDFEYYTVSPNIPDRSIDLFESSKWPFYVSNDSALIRKYHHETFNLYDEQPIKHYVLISVDDETIEVLSQCEPIFTLLP
ncbi:hypothetical protein [Marinicella litoralis]|uniref:Uncharacterized protein n=1 Tax=Marinicella litoralis TaxID=644220 RepID=A0A4R6XW01_9GAMM|nr:hypothetical protein [Marinicella litoralis]TDR22297.1 hypothetical protein C8D91_0775 [Marinicella litoralis]